MLDRIQARLDGFQEAHPRWTQFIVGSAIGGGVILVALIEGGHP